MPKFRKKPVVIDAYEFQNKVGPDTRPDWIVEVESAGLVNFHRSASKPGHLTIETLEGTMRAISGTGLSKA